MIFHTLPGLPVSIAPFSPATEAGGWVFLSGQVPNDPANPALPLPEGIAAQTRAVMRNLALVLEGLGLSFADVVQCRCYLAEFARDKAGFDAEYARQFAPGRLPARTTLGVTALALGALVEVECVARRPEGAGR